MPDLPDALNRLEDRVEALEQRVAALECPADLRAPAAAQAAIHPEVVQRSSSESFPTISTAALSVFGKAMLGIAGAYALRALAESNSLPLLALAAVAIAYALAWLVAASRMKARGWLRSATYACTAALILAPMLWELTLRFRVLTAPATATVLGLFLISASLLGGKRGFIPGLWVSYGTAAVLALALAAATHELVCFTGVLLLMVLLAEYRTMQGDDGRVWKLAVAAADAAIWGLIYIYAGPQNARADYPSVGRVGLIAPGVILFLISGLGVIVQTVVRRKVITWFEAGQATIAFLLSLCSVIYFGPQASATVLGVLCLALSGAAYAAVLRWFDRETEKRNSLVFATWSGALFIAGSLMGVPEWLRAAWLALAAPVAVFAGVRMRRPGMELHGVVFLLIAATISGLLLNLWSMLGGAALGRLSWGEYVIAACVAICYLATANQVWRSRAAEAISIVRASLVSALTAALLVMGMVFVMAVKMNPEAHHVAFIRTLALSIVAIGLALGGSRWRRVELTRIAYGVVALLGVKLVFEDLRHGHLAFVAGAIFLFAMTLIAVPRAQRVATRI